MTLTVFEAILLGLIQGITEYMPLSSTGHLALFKCFFSAGSGGILFDSMLHLGSLTAVLIIYRKDISLMLKGTGSLFRGELVFSPRDPLVTQARQFLMIAAAMLPTLILLFINKYAVLLSSMISIGGIGFIINGAILLLMGKYAVPGRKKANSMTVSDALFIGLAQLCAFIPGISRTAVTIAAGLARGLTKKQAVTFSLLLSVPAIFLTFIYSLLSELADGVIWEDFPKYIIGFLLSAAVSFVSIRILNKILDKNNFSNFAYYCFGIGVVTLILAFI